MDTAPEPTRTKLVDRRATAWCVGVVLPLVLVAVDPMVFRGGLFSDWPMLGHYRTGAYVALALAVAALAAVLLSRRPRPVLAGVLVAAALFGVAVGFRLLPLSIVGVAAFGLGLLGFVPFVTAFVFSRWVGPAFGESTSWRSRSAAFAGFAIYCGVCVGAHAAATYTFRASIDDLLSGSPERIAEGTARLERWSFAVDVSPMIRLWREHAAPTQREALEAAFFRVTGGDLEALATSYE